MDEGKIVLVGDETDVLHYSYSHAIKDNGKRYPSTVHYTHCMILSQLKIPEHICLDLLCVSASEVPALTNQLLEEHLPEGYDLDSLAHYLEQCRESYTMMGLHLRVKQDKAFEKALLDTRDSLIVVCDMSDRENGIGMDQQRFVDWLKREKVDSNTISYWFKNQHLRPANLGANKLGFYLMFLRQEMKDSRRSALLDTRTIEVDGLSLDDDDNPIKIKVNDLIISLKGIFRPLSNYFALPVVIKEDSYRSVEHYVYEKLFNALRLDDSAVEKLQTCVNPLDVEKVAWKVIEKAELDPEEIESKMAKMDRWRQSAMKKKFNQHDYLAQLLLSTGNSLIIDCSYGDPMWCCGSSEYELQHLLTKKYVSPATIINWMIDKDNKISKSVAHIKGNKTGLLLMELREKFANKTEARIPLISPITTSLSTISQHLICFTAESVFHPLYPAEIVLENEKLASPAHYVAIQAVNFFNFNREDREYVMEPGLSSLEVWERLHETIECRGRVMEREQSWWMERRQKAIYDGLKLMLEQHLPILRALLDTGDSYLVYCARFSSIESELSIGMREQDFRIWCKTCDLSTDMLMTLTQLPLAFRSSYLGGNRLGVILMQLRREFTLRGVFPQSLPELPLSVENTLGTDSPTENIMASEHFDVLDPYNYTSLFINPLFILAKAKPELDLWTVASYKKRAPRYVTTDPEKISSILQLIDAKKLKIKENDLYAFEADDLRAVFMHMGARLKNSLLTVEHQHQQMGIVAQNVARLQMLRRSLEDTRNRHEGRAAGGKEREVPERKRERTPPRRIYNDTEYKIPKRNRSPVDRFTRRDDSYRRNRSPYNRRDMRDREREKDRDFKERDRSPPKKRKEPTPPPVVKVKKVQRDPDAELSEGEILSSDED